YRASSGDILSLRLQRRRPKMAASLVPAAAEVVLMRQSRAAFLDTPPGQIGPGAPAESRRGHCRRPRAELAPRLQGGYDEFITPPPDGAASDATGAGDVRGAAGR